MVKTSVSETQKQLWVPWLCIWEWIQIWMWHAELRPTRTCCTTVLILDKVLSLCPALAQVSPDFCFWSMVLSQTQLDWACGSLSFHLLWTAKLAQICGEVGKGENRWPLTHLYECMRLGTCDSEEWKYVFIDTVEYVCIWKIKLIEGSSRLMGRLNEFRHSKVLICCSWFFTSEQTLLVQCW